MVRPWAKSGKPEPWAQPAIKSQVPGEAQPRLTSGGKAVATAHKITACYEADGFNQRIQKPSRYRILIIDPPATAGGTDYVQLQR